MYTQAITTAAKVPKADIAGISDRLVNTNALPVVKDVTDMAFIARDLCECVCVCVSAHAHVRPHLCADQR